MILVKNVNCFTGKKLPWKAWNERLIMEKFQKCVCNIFIDGLETGGYLTSLVCCCLQYCPCIYRNVVYYAHNKWKTKREPIIDCYILCVCKWLLAAGLYFALLRCTLISNKPCLYGALIIYTVWKVSHNAGFNRHPLPLI